MNGRDPSPLRRLAATTFGGAILGSIALALLFGLRRGSEGVFVWAIVGAVFGAAAMLVVMAAGVVLRFAFGDDPSLLRQTLLGAVVAGTCGAVASRGPTGLAVGVTFGMVLALVGGAILSLILRRKVIRELRSESASAPPPLGQQLLRGNAVAAAVLLSAVGIAVAATLLTLVFVLTPLRTVGPPVLAAALLGSLVEPSIVMPYVISKAARKTTPEGGAIGT